MTSRFSNISMNGRMAYTILCVETFLSNRYKENDWSLISKAMWKATSTNWGEWPDFYSVFIPSVLFEYAEYDDELAESMSEDEYNFLINLYSGITKGLEDDPSDEVTYMLNLPFEMAMIYEGTVIGDGSESFEIIKKAEDVLKKYNIPLPDYNIFSFTSINDHNGWGYDFDGTKYSIIIQ
ncbi:MAG: hypothetical protein K6G69_01425 [Lachnospiraceae bacterium]|nr:hypothetical protein [Lachnospiraceae bacterium]